MKSIIVYFSLTGNTKKIAFAVCKGIKSVSGHCEISTFRETGATALSEYDLIGFGSPVWGGIPANVNRYLDEMLSLDGKHSFVFCTHGALPERFFPPFLDSLAEKVMHVIGIRDWYCSVYRPAMPSPYLTDGHPDDIDLAEAEAFGKEMAILSRKLKSGELKPAPELPKMEMTPRNKLPRPLPILNPQKCRYPECTLCMDNCPVDAIDLTATPPVFARGCSICYFCEMICPEGAIDVDYESRVKASATHYEKFLNALEKAEKEGKFRRLIPLGKVGWDTPYYKVHNKHPRYVIPKDEK
jgi:Fe-S-cluster-containing hydrogenase component 2/flavodoxin